MARYRSGNRYLSEEEYEQEQDFYWAIGLFIIGASIIIYLLISIVNPAWPKIIRFLIVSLPAISGGYLLAKFQRKIRDLLTQALIAFIVFCAGVVVWNML